GHAVRSDGDDLTGAHQAAEDAVPFPMRGSIALTRRRPSVAPQTDAHEVIFGEKTFQIFVGRTDVAHSSLPGRVVRVIVFTTKITKDTKGLLHDKQNPKS